MKREIEPETVVEVELDYDELLESMQHALEWARGERELRTFTRSTDDAFYVTPEPEVLEIETGIDGKLSYGNLQKQSKIPS